MVAFRSIFAGVGILTLGIAGVTGNIGDNDTSCNHYGCKSRLPEVKCWVLAC